MFDSREKTRGTTRDAAGWRPSPKLIASAVAAVLVIVFALQNQERDEVRFYFWTVDSPLWMWFLLVLVIGVVIGFLLPYGRRKD